MIFLIVLVVLLGTLCLFFYGAAKLNADDGLQAVHDLGQERARCRELAREVDRLQLERDEMEAERDRCKKGMDLWCATAMRKQQAGAVTGHYGGDGT